MIGNEMSQVEVERWLAYWRRAPVSVVEFTNTIRAAIGLDPIPHGQAGKLGGRAYYAEGRRPEAGA